MVHDKHRPMISIVIPVYNSANWLEQCLDSILKQDYNNFEIICVNDTSTDSSHDIIKGYASRDARIRCLNFEENRGPGAARNAGIHAAAGPYLCFVDADDTLPPDSLSMRLKMLYQYKSEAVRGARCIIKGNQHFISAPCKGVIPNICPSSNGDSFFIHMMEGHLAFLFTKDHIIKYNAFNDESIRNNEDVVLQMRLFFKLNRVTFFDTVIYNYNKINEHSLTEQRWTLNKFKGILHSTDLFYSLAKKEGKIRYADSRFCAVVPWAFTELCAAASTNTISADELNEASSLLKHIDDAYSILERLLAESPDIIQIANLPQSFICLLIMLRLKKNSAAQRLAMAMGQTKNKIPSLTEPKSIFDEIALGDYWRPLTSELHSMRQSLSWRLTAPLRSFKRLVREKFTDKH